MAINGAKIIQAVMEGGWIRDEKGIIPIFGVYASLLSAQYYNRLCFEFGRLMGPERQEEADQLLVKAGQECAYNTFHGVRTSSEWAELVEPMIERKEDQIYGFIAVAVAFGWGDLETVDLVPGERLVLRARNNYEATGYQALFGRAASGKCFMLRGVTAGMMDLLYGPDYPDGCFAFTAQETKCRAKGDPYCEFVAQKAC